MKQDLSSNTAQIPRFMQLTELLQREISGGQYLPGDRLPPESQLAQLLDVAVGTLRKALAELETRGFVERRQGSGTYVRKRELDSPEEQSAVYQFFRLERLDGGGLPGAQVLDVSLQECPKVARQLQLNSRAKHWRIRRIRTLDQTPVAAEQICIPAKLTKRLTIDELSESLYEYYRQQFNQWIVRVEDSVGCDRSPDWFAVSVSDYCGVVLRTAWNQREEVAEVSTTWFDPAQCRYLARWS